MVFNAPHLFQQFGLFGEIRVGFKGSFQSVEEGAERAESFPAALLELGWSFSGDSTGMGGRMPLVRVGCYSNANGFRWIIIIIFVVFVVVDVG